MPNQPKSGAVLFAKDLPRVAKFYAEIVHLSVVVAERDHIILESAEFQLVVHAMPKQIAASIALTSPPEPRTDVPAKLFFPVASLAEARAKAPSLGGALYPRKKEWEARGFRACDGYDPEGTVVQLRETAL
jgi:predicted enzyme related to lactoylglutathione lyase